MVLLFASAIMILQESEQYRSFIFADVHGVRVDNIDGTAVVILEKCSYYRL